MAPLRPTAWALSPRPPVVKQDSTVHNSVNTDRGAVTIADVIETFRDEVLAKRGIETSVLFSSSRLASFLPVYEGLPAEPAPAS